MHKYFTLNHYEMNLLLNYNKITNNGIYSPFSNSLIHIEIKVTF